MKKVLKITGQILIYIGVLLGTLLSTAIMWMMDTWRAVTVDEIIYHIRAPKAGMDTSIVTGFLLKSLLPTVVITLVVIFVTAVWKKRKKYYGYAALGLSLCAGVFASVTLFKKLDLKNYLKNASTYSTFIDDNYVYPSTVKMTFPEQKRNLIFIFLESMETTFADKESGGAWDENLIPNLTKFSLENESFNGESDQLNGGTVLNKATYTIGAIYAESMGLPLILPFGGNIMSEQDSFMPELDGIGDVLEDAGYHNTFLIGSEAEFGGRNLFFRDHGNYEILDYNAAIENGDISENYRVFWGYEDRRLYEIAKKNILEDAASGQPFNMTLLTVDTHFEDGFICSLCEKNYGDNRYANVYHCADSQVAEFVSWAQEQDFYENTTIVVVGDHLTMDADFCEDVDPAYDRRVYLSIINGAATPENDVLRQYSTLDIFPTTLAALGVSIEGNRLGLGTNLYSTEPTLLELYGPEEMNTAFEQKSIMMEHLSTTVDAEKSAKYYENQWYHEAYEFAMERDIFMDNDSEFRPDEEITRGSIVQTLHQLEKEPMAAEGAGSRIFSDVTGEKYENALNWACENGIVNDYEGTGQFEGDGYVTREEMIQILYRYAQYKNMDTSQKGVLTDFDNVDQMSPWAVEAMEWGVGNSIISGMGGSDLAPQGFVTRAQAATMVMRVCEAYGI